MVRPGEDPQTLRVGGDVSRAGDAGPRDQTVTAVGSPPAPTHTPVSQDRFAPGTILADRYRIVAPLGTGGMGEVYRAQDLRLGQAVALKFISRRISHDPPTIDRVLAEVRIGRQVSHPNVCRIYDIVETGGHHFIAMEYVDGEDLASLLRRIRRLPEDKALDIARDLCAGLAAAHDRGVIHRDLKPSNIMIDGRGTARITDFGLAVISDQQIEGERLAGTPAYMAPEQFEGEPASEATDVYALGLILFELFTGQRLFSGSVPDIIAAHQQPKPRLSSIVKVNPVIERLVLRCLEERPAERPSSVRSVMAELPGGDALRAAIAAGETPSPRLVAAADARGELSPRRAWLALLATLAVQATIIALAPITTLYRQVPLNRSPDTLRDRARDVIRASGHESYPFGSRRWTDVKLPLLRAIVAAFPDEGHSTLFRRIRPAPIMFFYRESPQPLIASGYGRVDWTNPPPTGEGMRGVVLDTRGHLVTFQATPSEDLPAGGPVDWTVWMGLAGLDPKRFRVAPDTWVSPLDQDQKHMWIGTVAGQEKLPLEVRAASFRGRPVWFNVDVHHAAVAAKGAASTRLPSLSGLIRALLFGGALILSVVVARRNYVRGRGDRSGAMKIAVFAGLTSLVFETMSANHTTAIAVEWAVLSQIAGRAVFTAAKVWLVYMAVEPYIRRRQPEMLISWSRLLRGNPGDPLVGRHILLGCLFGMIINLSWSPLTIVVGSLFGQPPLPNYFASPLMGGAAPLLNLLGKASVAPLSTLSYVFLYALAKAFFRTDWLAVPLIVGLGALQSMGRGLGSPSEIVMVTLAAALLFLALRLAGLLGAATALATSSFMSASVFIFDPASWLFVNSLISVVVIAAVAIYAFKISLGMNPILGKVRWVD